MNKVRPVVFARPQRNVIRRIPLRPIVGGAFQPVPNVASFKFRHTGGGQLAGSYGEFTVYVRKGSDWSQADIQTVLTALDAWATSDYLPLLSSSWVLDGIVGINLEVEGAIPVEQTTNDSGTLAGDPISSNNAVYIRLYGTAGSPPSRGGMFWPVGNEGVADGVVWDLTWLATVQTAVDSLKTDIAAAIVGGEMVLVSRYASTNDDVKNARAALKAAIAATRRPTGLVSVVADIAATSPIASQRDRRPGE